LPGDDIPIDHGIGAGAGCPAEHDGEHQPGQVFVVLSFHIFPSLLLCFGFQATSAWFVCHQSKAFSAAQSRHEF
jgi:hypothetical protein